jgi:peptidoglycan hydrolase-like protein with peptidoglycan-binding domain
MHSKKFLLVPFLALLLVGALLFEAFGQTNSALAAPAEPTTSEYALNATAAQRSCPPTLRVGSRGGWVYLLQAAMVDQRITDWTGHLLVIDGKYGERTAYVVSVYQIIHGLHGDGITGPKTWHALRAC